VDVDLWQTIYRAATGCHDGPAGTVRTLASVDGRPRLGWVVPPPWNEVVGALRPWAHLTGTRRLIQVGTGGWAFAARALVELDGPWSERLTVLDVLDPAAVDGAAGGTGLVAVSESGRTLETRVLTEATRQRYGLRPHLLTGDRLWLRRANPSVALFGAPLTVPFLLAAATGTPDVGEAYRRFAARTDAIGRWAADAATRVPDGACRLRVNLPPGSPAGLRLYALQALRQGLGGEPGTAGLWADTGRGPGDGCRRPDLTVDLPVDTGDALTGLMESFHAINALVACVGLRRGIPFASHTSVDAYKRLVGHPGSPPEPLATDLIVPRAAGWLRERPALTDGHLVCYEPALTAGLAGDAAHLAAGSGRPWEVHPGTTWNHHSFQAVYGEPTIGVVVVAPTDTGDPLRRTRAGIAAATGAALGSRALLLCPSHPRR
jgi:hypothetical protein